MEQNKTLLVIGGSRGIGKAAARQGLSEGYDVMITGTSPETWEPAVEELRSAFPEGTISGRNLDVRNRAAVETFFSGISGEIDLLIYSAGYSYPGYAEEIPPEEYRTMIDINLVGAMETALAAFPFLKESRGKIVFISSLAGFMGVFGYAGYGASKGGLNTFAENLRVEWKRFGINVKLLCPPDVDTDMLRRPRNEKPEETLSISGTAKIYSPEFIAAMLFRSLNRKHFHIIPGFMSRITWGSTAIGRSCSTGSWIKTLRRFRGRREAPKMNKYCCHIFYISQRAL